MYQQSMIHFDMVLNVKNDLNKMFLLLIKMKWELNQAGQKYKQQYISSIIICFKSMFVKALGRALYRIMIYRCIDTLAIQYISYHSF